METRLPVNHYLHLREQGESHEKALAHSVQRYGILPTELLPALYESKRHHLAVAALLPDALRPDLTPEAIASRSPLNLAIRAFASLPVTRREQLLTELGVYERPEPWDRYGLEVRTAEAFKALRERGRVQQFVDLMALEGK